jgi:hypothetical protein
MILIPGVIDVTTNYVEHPQTVADRIGLFVDVMGGDPSRVIAGTDCGFSTVAGYTMVAEDVVWEKLRTLAEGAKIASKRLGLGSRSTRAHKSGPGKRAPAAAKRGAGNKAARGKKPKAKARRRS